MNQIRISLICLIAMFFSFSGFSQQQSSDEGVESEASREKRLRKITSGQGLRDMEMEIDIDIDQEAIDRNIAEDIAHAMRSLDTNLEDLDIDIDIDIPDLDIDMGDLELRFPGLDFDLEPIDIDIDLHLEDIGDDMEMNFHHFHDRDDDEEGRESKEDDRSKGLKKVN